MKLEIWAKVIGGAIYNSYIQSAKRLENSDLKKEPYYDEE